MLPRRLAWLLFASACLTPTEITVSLRGVQLTCPGGAQPSVQQTGVIARQQLNDPSDVAALNATGGVHCEPIDGTDELDLGTVVLVPQTGSGPVEVLALGSLDGVTAETCRAEYARLFNDAASCAEGDPCRSCIFARRSLAFVEHSNLAVRIELAPSCAGVVCDPSQTCLRGACVSAETECSGESCELSQGGAPVGGGGAGQGGGGGGGAGGAPPEVAWESWTTGFVAYDVVGFDATHEGFALFVAGGQEVYRLTQAGQPQQDSVAGSAFNYRALARNFGQAADVVAAGDLGLLSKAAGWALVLMTPPVLGNPKRFDAAPNGWLLETDVEASAVVPTGPTAVDGGALYGPPYPPTQRLFALLRKSGQDQLHGYDPSLATSPSSVTLPGSTTTQWSIWADGMAPVSDDFVVVAGTTLDHVFLGTCQPGLNGSACAFDPSFGTAPNPSNSSEQILALGGVYTANQLDLYAITLVQGQVNVAHAAPPTVDGSAALDWRILPSGFATAAEQKVNGLWIGRTKPDDASPSLFVATDGGVRKAILQLDQLF